MARTPKLDTWAKKEAYKAWQEEQDRLNGGAGSATEQPEGEGAPAAGFMSDPYDTPGLPAPSPYLKKALAKKPAERTPAEKEALKVRMRAEQVVTRQGKRIEGGIMKDLVAEEVAPAIGRRDAKAAAGYYEASEESLSAYGRGPDGQKIPAGGTTPLSTAKNENAAEPGAGVPSPAPGTSGGTITYQGKTRTYQGNRVAPGSPGVTPTGFAMRTMADGTVRGASPDGSGGTKIQNFGTREEAMAFYRPPQPVAQPGALAAAPAAPAPAAAPASTPDPVLSNPTAATSPFTSPTAKFNMGTSAANSGAAPAPVSPSAPPAAGSPAAAPAAPVKSAPALIPAKVGRINPEMGTPKRTGFQEMAENLSAYSPFGTY